jgi:hypothetical protein
MKNLILADNAIVGEEIADEGIDSFQETKHCMTRSRQRGIKDEDLALILLLGTAKIKPGGVYEILVRKRDKEKFITQLKQLIQKIDKLSGKTGIIDESCREIITTYHKYN